MATLTVEDAAGINAFVQQLQNAAKGAPPVDEETLALQLLASTQADGDFDTSQIRSLAATTGAAPVAMGAGDDKFARLAELMMGDTKTPEEQVSQGKAPKPQPVVIEDAIGADSIARFDQASALKNFGYLKDAQSVCQLFTNIMLVQTKPDGFDITKDGAEAFNTQASLAYKSMAGPMAAVYNFQAGEFVKHTFEIPKGDSHEKLLSTMFDGVGLDPKHKAEVDAKITNFTKALKDIKLDGPHSTVDFALRIGLCPVTNITADEANPILAFEPTTFLIYLKMDADAFTKTISKNNKQEKITFSYSQAVTKFELNVDRFLKMRPKYNEMFELATGMSLDKYREMLNASVKK
ncbi:hypothetical protein QBC47DRAFT_366442 [Echria macrotheca]|uniref:Uncharacterized protein n=1 Tax=Echria macrotheca TaxID=438768 RepID=A0AAJ0BMV0_9PEZI|nr:hypothetical protein QBC47DRAFT_366442 [Echria macrotheca]